MSKKLVVKCLQDKNVEKLILYVTQVLHDLKLMPVKARIGTLLNICSNLVKQTKAKVDFLQCSLFHNLIIIDSISISSISDNLKIFSTVLVIKLLKLIQKSSS